MPPSVDLPDAGTTAAEQSIIDQQIEDFIHSSVESTNETAPAPETAAEQPTEIPAPTAEDTTANDQLMAEALQDLSTPETTEAAPDVVSPDPSPAAPQTAEEVNDGIDVAGKKKLNPLPSEPKTDINELLAKEEAMEAAANPAPPTPVVDGAPADAENQPSDQPKAPPAQSDGFDPTNITL
jgi:hypothetical protein